MKDHSGDGITIAIYGFGVRPDGVESYGERAVAAGSIGHITGQDVIRLLKSFVGRQAKFGA